MGGGRRRIGQKGGSAHGSRPVDDHAGGLQRGAEGSAEGAGASKPGF